MILEARSDASTRLCGNRSRLFKSLQSHLRRSILCQSFIQSYISILVIFLKSEIFFSRLFYSHLLIILSEHLRFSRDKSASQYLEPMSHRVQVMGENLVRGGVRIRASSRSQSTLAESSLSNGTPNQKLQLVHVQLHCRRHVSLAFVQPQHFLHTRLAKPIMLSASCLIHLLNVSLSSPVPDSDITHCLGSRNVSDVISIAQ